MPLFLADRDYAFYARVLRAASRSAGCAIHAYVLMTNHVHLLVTPSDERGTARMMQKIGCQYVRYFNDQYVRSGTLWEGRYRSTVVDSERYFLVCSRYIELNPARAAIVRHPAQYRWSSFRHNAQGARDPLVTSHELYNALGATARQRQMAYRALFASHLEIEDVEAIRSATNTGRVLGPLRFREELETISRTRITRLPHGGDRRSMSFRETTMRRVGLPAPSRGQTP